MDTTFDENDENFYTCEEKFFKPMCGLPKTYQSETVYTAYVAPVKNKNKKSKKSIKNGTQPQTKSDNQEIDLIKGESPNKQSLFC